MNIQKFANAGYRITGITGSRPVQKRITAHFLHEPPRLEHLPYDHRIEKISIVFAVTGSKVSDHPLPPEKLNQQD
jgi:hypothetical protein